LALHEKLLDALAPFRGGHGGVPRAGREPGGFLVFVEAGHDLPAALVREPAAGRRRGVRRDFCG
jgi:hypothetical protein